MYVFMGHMGYQETKPYEDSFWERERLELVRGWVNEIDVEGRTLKLVGQPPITWDELVIATGSKSNKFGWPGQDLDGVQGLYGLPDLKRLYENARRTRHAVIVGGGLIGIELAEMLCSRGIRVTFLVREDSYWDNVLPAEESQMVNRHIREHGIGLKLSTELKEIVDDGSGRCCAVVTGDGERIECELVGLTAGVSPNVELALDAGIPCGRGVLVDWSLRTEVEGVYAAGDCAELVAEDGGRNTIQQVWYTGKKQGEVLADVLAGEARRYEPGTWFNSAKFLDLEYQTYGRVGFRVPGEESLVWEHPGGRHLIRIVHVDGVVIGFNLMGIRWRHEVCERWLEEGRTVDHVLERMADASFDPELFERHEGEAVRSFRAEGGVPA